MHNIGIIGDYDSICGYSALGIEIYDVKDSEEAKDTLKKMADGNFVIIFITEPLAESISDELEIYRKRALPSVIPIPALTGNSGFGLSFVKKAVEQAAGSDILFQD